MSNGDNKFLCMHGEGEKCDLHFLMEKSVMDNENRIEKLEKSTNESFDNLNKNFSDFTLEVRTYINTQQYRERDQNELRDITKSNSNDISEMKASLKSVSEHYDQVSKSIDKINGSVMDLTTSMKDLDKTVLSKDNVVEMVENAMIKDKNTGREKWFDSLPAKISAGVAIFSFIAFFTVKIVVLLLSI